MLKKLDTTKWPCWQTDAIGAGFCILATLAAYFLALRPLRDDHALFSAQQQELVKLRKRTSDMAGTELSHKSQLASVKQELSQAKIRLLPGDQINRRASEITKLLEDCGLVATSVQLGSTFRSSRQSIVPILLSGSGSYAQCALFFHKLTKSHADTGIASFEVTTSPLTPDETGGFRFELYWYAAPSAQKGEGPA